MRLQFIFCYIVICIWQKFYNHVLLQNIFITMQVNSTEVTYQRKFFGTNNSVRATLNPKSDLQSNNNVVFAMPKYLKQKKNSIANNKYNQSHSTSALPNFQKVEQINNCETVNLHVPKHTPQSIHGLHNETTQISTNKFRSKSKAKDEQASKRQPQRSKSKKFSLKYRCHQPSHHKSSTQIATHNNLRQTIQPNSSSNYNTNFSFTSNSNSYIPKHKQPDWIHKMQSYWKTIKSPKDKDKDNTLDKIIQKQENQRNQSGHLDPFSTTKQFQNAHDRLHHHKMQFRQTLDPQMDRNFWQQKKTVQNLPNKKKLFQRQKSASKIDRVIMTESKTTKNGHQLSHPNIFWRNKAVSPPSKPLPSQKTQKPQKNLEYEAVPLLPIRTHDKNANHRPSFFMSKKSVSRFNFVLKLGSGTYSDTFLCVQKKLNAIFCLKRYHKATLRNLPQILQIFIKKVAFQYLAEHPNIIQLYDIFCDGQFVYLIEQFMQGGSLHSHLQKQIEQRQQKRRETEKLTLIQNQKQKDNEQILLTESKIIDKIFDITSALCYIHQSCDTVVKYPRKKLPILVHGDVRTSSILVSLGVCKLPAIEPIHTRSGMCWVNSYSPPQQIVQQIYLPKSDVWNLGLVLFELCAERKLFGDGEEDGDGEGCNKPGYLVFNVNITQEIQKLSNTTHLLKELMKKLLMIQPEERPSSDLVMSSNVFKMYGFDVQWKQRRHEKFGKQRQQMINFKNNLCRSKKQSEQQNPPQNIWTDNKNQPNNIQNQINLFKLHKTNMQTQSSNRTNAAQDFTFAYTQTQQEQNNFRYYPRSKKSGNSSFPNNANNWKKL